MSLLPNASTYESLGGTIVDYSEIVDPTTDLPAVADCETRANVAAMTRMTKRVWFTWTNNGSVGTLVSFDSVVGNSATNYPTINKQATGRWRFTFPAAIVDAFGNAGAWTFKLANGSAQHNEPIHVQGTVVTPNEIDIYMWNLPAATANDVAGVLLSVEVL